ncbi:MAG: AI-2E family transporter, partial [Oscillospiraceae bacterium]|nr:AI-2E family transporter [Oscillospiraceae bacterium]
LDKKTIWKIIGIITAAAVIFAVFRSFTAVLDFLKGVVSIFMPFVVGAAIAFVINVPMRAIEKKLFPKSKKLDKARRPLAFVLTLLAVVAVVSAVLILVVPQLGETFKTLGSKIPEFMDKAEEYIEGIFKDYPQIQSTISELSLDWSGIMTSVSGWVQSGLSSTIDVAASAVNGVVSAFIGFVFAIYILLQKETLGNQARMILYALVPENAADRVNGIAAQTSKTFSNFLSGQCLEAVILGCMFAVVMLILRMNYVALISVLIAFTALIPLVGAFIGCFIGAFLIFMDNPLQALVFVIVFLIIQQIEGNLIYPKVVGESVGLPAMWVLFVVTIGGKIMGVIGMLIMIPASSVVYALFREFIVNRLRTKSTRVQKMFFRRNAPVNAPPPAEAAPKTNGDAK